MDCFDINDINVMVVNDSHLYHPGTLSQFDSYFNFEEYERQFDMRTPLWNIQ
jgi:hypothetical protein